MGVEGHQLEVHQQKQFLMNNQNGKGKEQISFEDFLQVYGSSGEDPETTQLTEDHTFVWKKLNRGELSEREFRAHPRRSALYEVVGGGHRKVSPFLSSFPYQPGDRFLLCSDGLVDGLWDKHIHATFLQKPDSTSTLAESLMSRAIENDGIDDTTLIALEVHDLGENSH